VILDDLLFDKPDGAKTAACETAPAIETIPEEDFLEEVVKTLYASGLQRFTDEFAHCVQLFGVLHLVGVM
jgi:hypothetical protein